MRRLSVEAESELRSSPKPVLVALLLSSCLIYLGAEALSCPWPILARAMPVVLTLSSLSIVGLILVDRRPVVGRWFTVLSLVAAVHLLHFQLGIAGALAWYAIPVALAAPLLGLTASLAVSIGVTALIPVLAAVPGLSLTTSDITVTLVSIWAAFGAMYMTYQPIRAHSQWLTHYFERAQRFLEEVRDRRAELEGALADLEHANRQLALMNERVTSLRLIAEEAQKAKTRFVARVSHEFRTPLNMIIGLVDLIVENPELYDVSLSPRMRDDLKVVHRNCEHLSNMVNDVLDLTRLESDRLVLHRERVDLRVILNQALSTVSPLLKSKQLSLSVSIPDNLPDVYCDRTRVQQVILNLVSNAARYTERGGITVSATQDDHTVTVNVQDTGPGIAPEDVDRIFEPFSQGSGDLWRDKGGSGLGLAISKNFVELHGGRMWVESVLGLGTTFSFRLPISPPITPAGRPGHRIREDWIWLERKSRPVFVDSHYRPRILVCDETDSLYAALTHYSDEVEFVRAHTLHEVKEVLERGPAQAVLVNLPPSSSDSWKLLRTIRDIAPDTPIIGCSVASRIERAHALGALDHLVKPVSREDLKQALSATDRPVKRVLIVDDDPDARLLFTRMLLVCDETLEIVTADSGNEAREQLKLNPPDLILLDIVLPEETGWEILETMANTEEVGKIPTIIVSAQDPSDELLTSKYVIATTANGLPVGKLLQFTEDVCSLILSPA